MYVIMLIRRWYSYDVKCERVGRRQWDRRNVTELETCRFKNLREVADKPRILCAATSVIQFSKWAGVIKARKRRLLTTVNQHGKQKAMNQGLTV